MADQPLRFGQVNNLFDDLKQKNPAFNKMTLPEFSDFMNRQTNTQNFSAGQTDNWLMRASSGFDELIGKTGLPSFLGDVGAGLGGAVSQDASKTLRQIFQDVPRDLVNLAPAMFTAATPLAPLGIATTAALAGTSGYERSGGSVPVGLISGATAGAMPAVARMAGQKALQYMGAPLVEDLVTQGTSAGGKYIAKNVGQRLGEVGAENVAATALGELGGQASSVATGQGLYNPLAPENLVAMIGGNIPFAVLDLPQLVSPLAPKTAGKAVTGAEIGSLQRTLAERIQSNTEPMTVATDEGFVTRNKRGEVVAISDTPEKAMKVETFVREENEAELDDILNTLNAELQMATQPKDLAAQALAGLEAVAKNTADAKPLGEEQGLLFSMPKIADDFVKSQGTLVYHGSNARFDKFDPEKIGEATGAGDWGDGFYFSDRSDVAKSFAEQAGGDVVMEFVLPKNLKFADGNKLEKDPEIQNILGDDMGFTDMGEYLKGKGYDGVKYKHSDGSYEYVVYDPAVIKTKAEIAGQMEQATAPKFSMPEQPGAWKDQLNEAKKALDAREALLRYQDTVKLALGKSLSKEEIVGNVRSFLNSWEEAPELLKISPQEAVTRALNKLSGDVEKQITAAKMAEGLTLEQRVAMETIQENPLKAAELLPPEWAAKVAQFIRSRAFRPLEEGGEGNENIQLDARRKDLESLRDSSTDPDIRAAVEQQIDYIGKRPDENYDKELAGLLENYTPYQELSTQAPGTKVQVRNDISDVTEKAYAYAFRLYNEGKSPDSFRPSMVVLLSDARREGVVAEQVPILVKDPEGNFIESGGVVKDPAAVQEYFEHLRATNEDPAVSYRMTTNATRAGGEVSRYPVIIKTTNKYRALVENAGADVRAGETATAGVFREGEGGEDFMELYNRVDEVADNARNESRRGISGGVEVLMDTIFARRRALMDYFQPEMVNKSHRDLAKERLAVLLEAETKPDFWRKNRKGEKVINHEFVQEALRQAGGLEIPVASAGDAPKVVPVKVNALLEAFNGLAARDPMMMKLTQQFRLYQDWQQSAPRDVDPDYYAGSKAVKGVVSKMKNLYPYVDVLYVPNLRELRMMDAEAHKAIMEKGGYPEAYYDAKKKRIVLIHENLVPRNNELNTVDAAMRAMWHEGAGHYGMETMLGGEYNAVMRRVLRSIPDAERESIATLYGIKDRSDILIAMEYVARKAETDPNMGLLSSLGAELRNLSRKIGRFLGNEETGFVMSDGEIMNLVRQGRNFVLNKRGLLSGSNYGTVSGPLEDSPNSFDGTQGSRYFSIPPTAKPVSDLSPQRAWDFLVQHGNRRGLGSESTQFATDTVEMLTKRPDSTSYEVRNGELFGQSPLGGTMRIKTARSPIDNLVRAQEAQYLHTSFAKALESERPESPIVKASVELNAWLQSTNPNNREGLVAGLEKAGGMKLDGATISSKAIANEVANAITNRDQVALKELLEYAPAPVAHLTKALMKHTARMAEGGLSLRQAEELGLTQQRGVGNLQKKALEKIYDSMVTLREHDLASEQAAKYLSRVEELDPDHIMTALEGNLQGDKNSPLVKVSEAYKFSLPDSLYRPVPQTQPKEVGFFTRNINLPSNIAEQYPEFRPFLRTATAYNAVSQLAVSKAFEQFGIVVKGGKMTQTEDYQTFRRVAKAPHLRKALSALGLRQNEKVEDVTNQAVATNSNPAIGSGRLTAQEINQLRQSDPVLKTLSDKDFKDAVTVFEGMTNAAKEMGEVLINGQLENIASAFRMQLGKAMGWQHLPQVDLAVQSAMQYLKTGQVPQKPAEARNVPDSEFGNMLLDIAKFEPLYSKFANYLRGRDGYLPEFRVGNFVVSYKDKATGVVKTIGAKDLEEVYSLRDQLVADGVATKGDVKYQSKKDARIQDSLLSKGVLERAQEIETAAMSQLRAIVGDTVFDKVKDNYEPLAAALQKEKEKTMQDFLKKRKLAGGREELDFLETLLSYIPAVSYGVARSYVKKAANFYLQDARLADNEPLRTLAEEHIKNVLRPSTTGEKAVREAAFQYFMGLNVSTMAFEGLQSLSTLAPWLTRHGAGFAGSYGELKKAASQLFDAGRKGKFADAELDSMMMRAVEETVIGRGLYQELEDPSNSISEIQDAVMGAESKSRAAVKSYMDLTRNLYGTTAFYNSRLAFVAGYNRGKKMGLKGEDLYDFATRTVQTTMFTGGKANRPIGLHSGERQSQPLRAMISSLQSYFIGMVGTMERLARESFTAGLPPAEKANARKALMQMLGTQFALAGTMGMPFVAAAVAVMDQFFPELEIKKNMEELPKTMLGDSAFGNWMVDTMLYGAPTASSPLDVSARVGLGQVLGVNAMSGLDPATLFGPVGSIAGNAFRASQSVGEGNFLLAAEQISPVFMKNILKAVKDDGAVRDYSGNLVTQMTGGQQVMQALGFRPKEIGDLQDQLRTQKKSEEIARRQEGKFNKKLAESLVSNDMASFQQALYDRQQEDALFDPKQAAKTAAARAADMTLPKELGRGGSVRNAESIGNFARTQTTQAPSISELARVQQQLEYERMTGIPGLGMPTPARFQNALMIDQLRAMNPGMTVDEARAQMKLQQVSQRPPVMPVSGASALSF